MSSPSRSRPQDTERLVPDACALLQGSLTALMADARAIRQLAAGRRQVLAEHPASPDFQWQLRSLEQVVSSLEDKVHTFREIIAEEQRAMVNLEAGAAMAASQVTEFQKLHDFLEEFPLESPRTPRAKPALTSSRSDGEPEITHENNTPHHARHRSLDESSQQGGEDDAAAARRQSIQLDLVSQEEFTSVPRATRGRISRALVNEAVLDIEKLLQQKEVLRLQNRRKHRAMLKWNKGRVVDDGVFCSEQEMRQSCAFFRSGESSARGVLTILRHLHRLKHIPSGNGEIVYVLP
jgi:hypothetical protein